MNKRILVAVLVCACVAIAKDKTPKQTVVNIQKTSLTKEQEEQLGQQAAAQVQKQMEVVNNPTVEAWLNRIGQSLAKTPEANAYPYYFKLVNEDSINAFALPGGPMFVHTGLIKAADNEDEVAGVLAHEMSHVALRHGAAQISKQQTWGTLFGVLQQGAGALGCGALCQAASAGLGLGGNSLLMKFSRGYEHDADINGARMLYSAGYDPIGLPTFFQKLEAKLGTAAEPKGLALWMSSHPATGNRIQYVQQDIQFYQPKQYSAGVGDFQQIKQIVSNIPPAKLKPPALLAAVKAQPREGLPTGFQDFTAKGFSIGFPQGWQVGQVTDGGSVYLIPQGGAAKDQSGGVELISGAMIDYYVPDKGAAVTRLDSTTAEFLNVLKKGDPNMRTESSSNITLDGKPALLTRVQTRTANQLDQTVYVYTTVRQAGLWYMAQASPTAQAPQLDPAFRQMAQTLQFARDIP
jgi:Zn-dependent protease with chaperone function